MDFWVVVSNIFVFRPYLGKIPILTKGSKPPTRFMLIVFGWFLFKGSRSNRQIVIKKRGWRITNNVISFQSVLRTGNYITV